MRGRVWLKTQKNSSSINTSQIAQIYAKGIFVLFRMWVCDVNIKIYFLGQKAKPKAHITMKKSLKYTIEG